MGLIVPCGGGAGLPKDKNGGATTPVAALAARRAVRPWGLVGLALALGFLLGHSTSSARQLSSSAYIEAAVPRAVHASLAVAAASGGCDCAAEASQPRLPAKLLTASLDEAPPAAPTAVMAQAEPPKDAASPPKLAAESKAGPKGPSKDSTEFRTKVINSSELSTLLAGTIASRPVFGTIANAAFRDMLLNWAAHTRKAGMMRNVIMAALDEETYELCSKEGIPSLQINAQLTKEDFRADPAAFKDMGALKTAFVLSLLEAGRDVVMSDTDTVWLADPSAFLAPGGAMSDADVAITSDSISHSNDVASVAADSREWVNGDWQGWFRTATPRATEVFGNAYEHAFNTGALFLRAGPATITFATAWHEVMRTKGKSMGWDRIWGDQHALNQLMRIDMFPIDVVQPPQGKGPRNNRIFWTFGKRLRLGVLPVAQFCNGHVYFVQRIPQRERIQPFVVHNTFQFHFAPGKTHRFREDGLWALDPPEYYEKGNFLSFNATAPAWILGMKAGIAKHQAAIQYYYEATRNAMVMARILNRILILPTVMCYCDRWWNSLTAPCRAPGGDVDPPFVCPMDYFVNSIYWNWGSEAVPYRVHTFLNHPMVPKVIRQSRVEVHLKDKPELLADKDKGKQAWLPKNATDTEVANYLAGLSDIRVLHFPDAFNSFCRYEDNAANEAFDTLTPRHLYEEWCCTADHQFRNFTISPLMHRSYDSCKRGAPLLTGAQ